MQLQKIKNTYMLEENGFYKNELLKPFAQSFLNSIQPTKYKLYHQYIFRSEIWEKHIKEQYDYKLKDSEFSWSNPNIQDIIEEHSHFFVGYIKPKYKKKYCELFLSIRRMKPWRLDPRDFYHVNGYSINIHDNRYSYMYENTVELGYKSIDVPIIIDDGDILKAIKFWNKKINKNLLS